MFDVGAFWYKSLTMTYFHRCTSTIIGAKAFHDPVRDGKGWDHLAMVVKRKRVVCSGPVTGAVGAGAAPGQTNLVKAQRVITVRRGRCLVCVLGYG